MKKLQRSIAILKIRLITWRAFLWPKLSRKKKMLRSFCLLACLFILGFGGVVWRRSIENQKPANILKKYNEILTENIKTTLASPADAAIKASDTHFKLAVTLKPDAFSEADREAVRALKDLTVDLSLHTQIDGQLSAVLSIDDKDIHVIVEARFLDQKELYFKTSGLATLEHILPPDTPKEQIDQLKKVADYMNDKWFVISGLPITASNDQQNKFIDTLTTYLPKLFVAGDKVADGQIGNKSAYGLKVTLDETALQDYLNAFYSSIPQGTVDKEQLAQTYKTFFDKYDLKNYPLTMYIDKDFSGYHGMSYQHSYTHADVTFSSENIPNKQTTIDKPADAHTLLELIGNVQKLIDVKSFESLLSTELPTTSAVVTAEEEQAVLIAKVAALYTLPTDEVPSIATVEDPSKLSGQAFFKDAKKGDKLLIYTTNSLGIIYRESSNEIINAGPVSSSSQIQTQ